MGTAVDSVEEACLRAGWVYHLKTTLGKRWHRKWVTIKASGTMTVAKSKTSKRRNTQTYDLKRDCMFIWTAGKCQHLLPPAEVDRQNLIELLLTGDRRLAFCAMTLDESELWLRCIETARSEKDVPTPRVVHGPPKPKTEEEEAEEGGCWCCVRKTTSSKVKVVDYTAQGQSTS